MFESKHYVPILKWKGAEQRALKELRDDNKKYCTPLFQLVMPKPKPLKRDEPAKSEDERLEEVIASFKEKIPKISEEILKSWGKTVAFIDTSLIYTTSLKVECIKHIFLKRKELGIHLIPVLNLSDDQKIKDIVWLLAKKDGNGLCLRLVCADLNDMKELSIKIKNFLEASGLRETDVDLLVDIKDIYENNSKYAVYRNLSQEIPNLTKWRTFTFASGAFPIDLTQCKIDEENLIPRLDWKNWINQIKNEKLRRIPAFADYTIQHPIYKESFQFHAPSTSIKYTLKNNWLILKGKKYKYYYYLANAKILLDDSRFFGESFSFGDRYITEKGNHFEKYIKNPEIKGTGNALTWITAGINHHLVCTVDQIANLT